MTGLFTRLIPLLSRFTQNPLTVIFAAALGMSFFFSGTDTVYFAPALFLFLAWAGGSLGYGIVKESTVRVPCSVTALFTGLFVLYLWFALFFSTAPYISTLFTLIFSLFALIPLSLWGRPEPQKKVTELLTIAVAALIVAALWALVQFFFFYESYGPRIHHPLLNPNSLAALLNIGFILAVAFFMTAQDKGRALRFFAVVMLLAAALYVTRSRGAFLAAGTALTVLLPLLSRPFDKARKVRLAWLFLGLVGVVTVITLWAAVFLDVNMTRGMRVNLSSASFVDRGALWTAGLAMIRDHILMGPGLATFSYYYPSYRLPVDLSDGYFLHMDPLQVGVETGIAGWVLFYAVFIAILCRTFKALKRTQPGDPLRRDVAMSFAALLTVALHSHVSFHFYILVTAAFAALLLGFWYLRTAQILGEDGIVISLPNARRWLVAALLLVVFVVPMQWIARAGYATYMLQKSGVAVAAGELERATASLDKLERWGPSDFSADGQIRARIIMKKLEHAKEEGLSLAEKQALFATGLAAIDKTIELNSGLPGFLNTKAKLYYVASDFVPGAKEEVEALLVQVLERNPLLLDARMGLARMYEERGEFRKALSLLDEGMKWPRQRGLQDVAYLMKMASLNLRLGNRQEYIRLKAFAVSRAKALGYHVQ